jgi:hypothetical protein
MTEDSGEPKRPEDEPGYWERKAAEDAERPPPPPQVQFNPQSGVPPYPQAPGQPGWPAQPGMQPYPVYVMPDHPRATAALVTGIVAVAGTFVCLVPVLASPVAWILGANARREIRNAPQQWGGESKATAGMVLGIIGTVLLVLGILAFVLLIIVAINDPSAFDEDTGV